MVVDFFFMGIWVNCVVFGFISIFMLVKVFNSDLVWKEKVLFCILIGYFGIIEDVVNVVYFLVLEDVKFIIGEVFKVDGGNFIGF